MSKLSEILSTHLIACVDLEATCNNDNSFPRSEMEIIEFGCTVVDPQDNYSVVATYNSFVRPTVHPTLTDFCKQLTTIKQSDVDGEDRWIDVSADIRSFFEDLEAATKRSIAWVSWGDYDRNQILKDNKRWHLNRDCMPSLHFNLKRLEASRRNSTKESGLRGALQHANIEFPGTLHRACDDAFAVALMLKAIGHSIIRGRL